MSQILYDQDRCRAATTILPLSIGPMNGSHIWHVNTKALARYQIILLGEKRHIGVSNLLPDGAPAGSRTRDLSITSLTR